QGTRGEPVHQLGNAATVAAGWRSGQRRATHGGHGGQNVGTRASRGGRGSRMVADYLRGGDQRRGRLGAGAVVPAALARGGLPPMPQNRLSDRSASDADLSRIANGVRLSGSFSGAALAIARGGPRGARATSSGGVACRCGQGGGASGPRCSPVLDLATMLAPYCPGGGLLRTQGRRRARLENPLERMALYPDLARRRSPRL